MKMKIRFRPAWFIPDPPPLTQEILEQLRKESVEISKAFKERARRML